MTWLVRALSAPALLWLAGFAWFIVDAAVIPAAPPARADGIVALTGGADRVPTALRLLRQGAAPRLLLSGVNRGVTLHEVARAAGLDADDLAAAIAVGYAAEDTRGNAGETAAWVSGVHARSLLVVTSGYHMRRALLELRRALPGVRLYPVPVRTGRLEVPVYAAEYTKLLVALIHPAGSLQGGLWGLWTSLWGASAAASPRSVASAPSELQNLIFFLRETLAGASRRDWG